MKGKNFLVKMHIYPFDVMFSIDQTNEQLKVILDGIEECSTIDGLLQSLSLENTNGCAFIFPKGSSIVRLKSFKEKGQFEATLSHEILHVVHNTLSHIGMDLSNTSVEAYCYLQAYLVKQFYQNFVK